MMNNCFICSRESYDFERHGGVTILLNMTLRGRERKRANDCDITLEKNGNGKKETWKREILYVQISNIASWI